MSYTPTVWTTGDIVTAEKLNKMEGGIEDANEGGGSSDSPIFYVTISYDETTGEPESDKTFEEIATAFAANKIIIAREQSDEYNIWDLYTLAYFGNDSDDETYVARFDAVKPIISVEGEPGLEITKLKLRCKTITIGLYFESEESSYTYVEILGHETGYIT